MNCKAYLITPGSLLCREEIDKPASCDISCLEFEDQKEVPLKTYPCTDTDYGDQLPHCAILEKKCKLTLLNITILLLPLLLSLYFGGVIFTFLVLWTLKGKQISLIALKMLESCLYDIKTWTFCKFRKIFIFSEIKKCRQVSDILPFPILMPKPNICHEIWGANIQVGY